MRKGRPLLMDGDKEILRRTQGWVDPVDVSAEATNEIRADLAGDLPQDPYARIQAEALDGVHHGGKKGKGYLRPPRGGYIDPPTGGFAFLPLIAAAVAPALVDMGFSGLKKIFGFGRNGKGERVLLPIRRPLNMTNAHSFYKSLVNDMAESTNPEYAHKKMDKLFGSGWKKYYRTKHGGGDVDELKMGHLLMPAIEGHLKKALTGTGIDPEQVLELIENNQHEILDRPVTSAGLQSGGSIFGSIWNGIKKVFGKITGNKTLGKIASKAVEGVTKGAEKALPGLAEKGVEKLAEYATKKITGEEPEISEDKLISRQDKKIAQMKRDAELRKLERQMEKEEENDYEEPEPTYRKPTNRRYEEEEPVYRKPSSKRFDEGFDMPSGKSDSALRKKIIAERGMKKPVIKKTTGYQPGMRIIGTDANGDDIYGWGLGTKKKGGSWVVRLQH